MGDRVLDEDPGIPGVYTSSTPPPGLKGPLSLMGQAALAAIQARQGLAPGQVVAGARPGPAPAPGSLPGVTPTGIPGLGAGSTGTAFQLPKQAPPGPPSQMPYASMNPYRTGTQRKEALATDLVVGMSNLITAKRRENEQRQFKIAEATWSQLMSAQQRLQANPQDQEAKQEIDAILSDKKRMKMVEDSLGVFLPKEPGGEQEKPTPESHGAKAAISKFVRGAFNTQTPAQRMPGGQGPAPNTPGGYRFAYPQQSAAQESQNIMDREMLAMLQQPGMARKMAEIKSGLRMTPAQEAQEKLRRDTYEFNKDKANKTYEINKQRADTAQRQSDEYIKLMKARERKLAAGTAGEGGGGQIERWYGTSTPQAGALPKDAELRSAVLSIANGQLAPKDLSGFVKGKSFSKNDVLAAVGIYTGNDPVKYSSINYEQFAKVSQNFRSGVYSQAITSLNQVIHHASGLQSAYNDLHNTEWSWLNPSVQRLRQVRKGGNPALKAYDENVLAVASELSRVFRGTGALSLEEIQHWREMMSRADTPEEFAKGIAKMYELIDGRFEALQGAWDRGSNSMFRPMAIYDPQSRAILSRNGLGSMVDHDNSYMGSIGVRQVYTAPTHTPSAPIPTDDLGPPPPMPPSDVAPQIVNDYDQTVGSPQ